MQTFCLNCKKHTDNIGSRKVIMPNKVVRQTSKCANCVSEKSIFLKKRSNKKTKHVDILVEVQKNTENVNSKVFKTKNGGTVLSSK